jgi:hypothetical protein
VCEHCLVMDSVLTDLVGTKVSRVIMSRVARELHNPEKLAVGMLAPEILLEGTGVTRPKSERMRY